LELNDKKLMSGETQSDSCLSATYWWISEAIFQEGSFWKSPEHVYQEVQISFQNMPHIHPFTMNIPFGTDGVFHSMSIVSGHDMSWFR
jgi:hypothetical protein